ncbi:rCG56956 [Rattus norvegicus]|uniref:RCG56956 n=1 Tax=Rattus norvegicus TaxID=10116 RepID=A6JDB2_RAT|nr:rCG56956 [Rattus norvegicus]
MFSQQGPVFEGRDRFCVFDSNVITYHGPMRNCAEVTQRQQLMWYSGWALPIVTLFLHPTSGFSLHWASCTTTNRRR